MPRGGARVRRSGRFLAIVAGLMLPLLMLEAGLHLFGPILPGNYSTGSFLAPHPLFGRFHVPNFDGWIRTREYTSRVTINSLGLRGPERGYDRPDGVRRVLFLGDSFIEAAQVAEAEGVVGRVEGALNARADARYEVLNGGVAGWGQHQQLAFLEAEGLRYGAEVLVLVLYLGNDLADNSFELQGQPRRPTEPYWVFDDGGQLRRVDWSPRSEETAAMTALLRRRTMLWNVFETAVLSKITGDNAPDDGDEEFRSRQMVAFSTTDEDRAERAWRITLALVERIVRIAEREQMTAAVVAAPAMFQVYSDDWARLLQDADLRRTDWSADRPNRVLSRRAHRLAVPVLDLLPAFRAAARDGATLYYPSDRHWTPAGHALAAREIDAFLGQHGLVQNAAR